MTASSCTMSPPPQAPGPINRGKGSKTAILPRRPSQSVGALVTSVELKSGPAASRKDCSWLTIGGRGLGSGTSSATAKPAPEPASHISAIKNRIGLNGGEYCGG